MSSKFLYLKSSLEGTALRTIQSFEVADSYYEAAVKVLADRFENKKYIPAITANILQYCVSNADILREFIDKMNINMRSLSSLHLHWASGKMKTPPIALLLCWISL